MRKVLLVLCLFFIVSTAVGQVVSIPDANLRAAVETALGKASGDTITAADMAALTVLNADTANISDLTGLEQATNLTELYLYNNYISDVSPLAGLINLKWLSLYNNELSDVSPLAGLINLEWLFLENNQLSDVSPLAGLINLKWLTLSANELSDVSPLVGLINLTGLFLSNNYISDVSPLAGLINLTVLYLHNNELSDVSPLAGLINLTGLTLSANELSDVSPLAGLINLITLYLHNNYISDFSPIAGLIPNLQSYLNDSQKILVNIPDPELRVNIPDPNLRAAVETALGKASGDTITRADMQTLTGLTVESEGIQDLTGLEFATNLERLYLSDNELSDVSPLVGLINLKYLSLYNNELSDVSPLAGLINLKWLYLHNNELSNVSPLAGLINLTVLYLSNNELSDVSPLAGLINLTVLYLHNNELSDVSPLAGLINLTRLDLSDNSISDFSPIAGLIPNLQRYWNDSQKFLVNIPDPNLRAAIEKELGKAPGATITTRDMQVLTGLTVESEGIQDLTGLEFATNLTVLYLDNNELSDVSPLAGLINLEWLFLENNQLSDVSPLAGLINLTVLYLHNNELSNVSPLAGLINLTGLYLDNNQLSDVSPLAGLINLEWLFLENNQLSDVSPLAGLINLTSLYLHNNELSNVSPLAGLINLTGLYLDNNQLSDVSPLAGLINLKYLYLHNNELSNVSPLAGLINLEWLFLENNQLSDVSPLAGLINLKYLYLHKNQLSNVSPLAGLINLTSLNLYRNQLSDVSPLAGLINLTLLDLYRNQLSDVSPLAGLINLEWLTLSYNDISDVSPLAGLINLTLLDLHKNQLSDVSPLAGLINLKYLYLYINDISDVSPLAGLINLTTLILLNNKLSDVSPLAGLINLTTLYLDNNRIWDFSPIARLIPNLVTYGKERQTFFDTCGFTVPHTDARLEPTGRVAEIVKEQIALKEGGSVGLYASTKSAPFTHEGETVNWTRESTEANDDDEDEVIITVKFLNGEFLNGESKEIEDVKWAAREWEKHGELLFKFLEPDESGKSDIRIEFNYDHYREMKESSRFEEMKKGSPPDEAPSRTGKFYNAVEAENYEREGYFLQREAPSRTGKFYNAVEAENYEKEGYFLQNFRKWSSKLGTLAKAKSGPTMWLTTNYDANDPRNDGSRPNGTILHEFGHALGLVHEHLSPKFNEHFEWVGIEDIIKRYMEEQGWTRKRVYDNLFNTATVDTSTTLTNFDPDSIMTYGIIPEDINARSSDSWVQQIAEDTGVPNNYVLSDGDKAIIEYLYPKPREAWIVGSISIHARDDDFFSSDDWYDIRKTPTRVYTHYTYYPPGLTQYLQQSKVVARWGGESRIEVHVLARKILETGIEAAAVAFFYEEESVDNTDLDDVVCETFFLPFGEAVSIPLPRMKIRDLSELEFSHDECVHLMEYNELYLGDILSFDDDSWADVTVRLRADLPIYAVGLAPSTVVTTDTASGDVNRDGQINVDDLVLVSNHLGQTDLTNPRVDVNGDGIVTIADLVQVAQHLGESTVSPAPAPVAVPADLTYETVQGWIDHARAADDGSLVFRQGIANLESLLASLIPEKTVLLPNYPNPFNPETWIPYHLSEPADVTLNIYSVDGKVVRHLELGHQAAGYYQSRSRAAYWDGRNAVGEPVASGVFFYTLTAGDFSAIRKMVILK